MDEPPSKVDTGMVVGLVVACGGKLRPSLGDCLSSLQWQCGIRPKRLAGHRLPWLIVKTNKNGVTTIWQAFDPRRGNTCTDIHVVSLHLQHEVFHHQGSAMQ